MTGSLVVGKRQLPAELGRAVLRNRYNIAPPTLGGAAAVGAGGRHDERQQRPSAPRTATAVGASAAGYGGFKAYGVSVRNKARSLEQTNMPDQSNSKRKKIRDDHLKSHGLHPNQPDLKHQLERRPEVSRSWPDTLASSPHRRRLGQMSGRRGMAMEAAAVGLPGAAVLGSRRRKQQDVGKASYGYQEKSRSIGRSAEFTAGAGIAAYGLSRSKMLGPIASYGARLAEKQGAKPKDVERVMSAARAVAHGTRQVTGKGEEQARKVKVLNDAIDLIPAGLRPAVATSAGIMLANHARPVSRERFIPTGRTM